MTPSQPKIHVIDYGMGNIRSITKVLERLNISYKVSANTYDLAWADRIILPGVGAFGEAMENLHELGLVNPITEAVIEQRKPILGICLGMQLLAKSSPEGRFCEGFGFIDGHVQKLTPANNLRLPHISWAPVDVKRENILIDGLENQSFMYFVHDYIMKCKHEEHVVATSDYGGKFCAIVAKENVFGVQFHPEKSQRVGATIMTNFVLGALS